MLQAISESIAHFYHHCYIFFNTFYCIIYIYPNTLQRLHIIVISLISYNYQTGCIDFFLSSNKSIGMQVIIQKIKKVNEIQNKKCCLMLSFLTFCFIFQVRMHNNF